MDGLGYLGLAYALVWVGIALFLFSVTRRQRSLEKRVEELTASEKSGNSK